MGGIKKEAAQEYEAMINEKTGELTSMEDKLAKYKQSLMILKEEYDSVLRKNGELKS